LLRLLVPSLIWTRWLGIDKYVGSLEVGKFADLILLERDYFTVPLQEIGRNSVTFTMVGGQMVYLRKDWRRFISLSNGQRAKRDDVDAEAQLADQLMQPAAAALHDDYAFHDGAASLGRQMKSFMTEDGHLRCGCGGH
jgi:hypothetical protein